MAKKCSHWSKPHTNCGYCYLQASRFEQAADGGGLDLILEEDNPIAPYERAVEMGYTFVGVTIC